MYRLEDTGAVLLLTVPYPERERAKAIAGRKWDPERKAWIYPRTKSAYDALIAEFGSELERVKRPAFPAKPVVDAAKPTPVEKLDSEVAHQLKELQRALHTLKQGATSHAGEIVDTLKDQLKRREESERATVAENKQLVKQVAELESKLEVAEGELQRAQYRASRDAEELARLRAARAGNGSESPELGFKNELIRIVSGTAPRAHELSGLIKRRGFHDQLPVEIGGILETTLRAQLKLRERASLFDLIDTARDAELLTDEGYHMATTVRVERNKVAHDNVAVLTYPARALLALAAATLFYSELE